MAYEELHDDNFDDKLKQVKGLLVVEFWAPWCGPCKLFAQVFDKASEELTDFEFAKVNTDEAQGITQRYAIRSVPTIMIFKNGLEVDRFSGVFNREQFEAKLRMHLD